MAGVLHLSPWRRAPFLLLRSPAVAAAVAAATAVLVLVVASPTLFVSAVGGAAIRSDIVDGCRYGIGLTVANDAPLPVTASPPQARTATTATPGEDSFENRRRFIDGVAARTPGTSPPVVTMTTGPVDATSGRERPGDGQVQLMARTGAARHVRWVDGGPGNGAWLPDRTAKLLDVGAGDDIALVVDGTPVPTHVDGVFEDLAYVADRGSFWCSTERAFEPFGSYTPPPVVLMDQAELTRVLRTAGRSGVDVRFEIPPAARGLAMPVAADAAAVLDRAAVALRAEEDPTDNPFAHGRLAATTGLPGSVEHARQVGNAVRPLVETVSVAAFVIALLVVAAAGRSWSDARGGEIRLLQSKGVSPAALSVKAALEMVPAALVGGGLGLLAARSLVVALGPSALIGADATARSVATAAAALAGGIVVLSASAMAAVGLRERRPAGGRTRGWRRFAPWELALLALAAVAFVQLRSPAARVSTAAGTSYPADRLLVLFPLLLLCGGGALAARLLRTTLPALRRRGTHLPLPLLLAARRSSTAGPAALALVVGTALSVGIFLYASVISASARATVTAKATLGPGSDLVVFPGTLHEKVPRSLADRASLVVRSETDVVGGERASVLAVDRRTFAKAAFFDPTFADASLDELLERLAPHDGRIPVVAVGPVPPGRRIAIGTDGVRLDVVARPHAFPGQRSGTPMLVVDRASLDRAGLPGTTEMWVRGDPVDSIAAIHASPFDAIHFVRANEGLEASSLLPLATSLDYFRALGLLGGLVTISGVVLYLMAKERERGLALVMTRRMGLRTSTAVLANALEVGGLLVVGLLLAAALAVPAGAAVFPHLDPSPETPPDALVRLDLGLVAAALGACALVAVTAAAGSVVASLRRSPAEVMRLVP